MDNLSSLGLEWSSSDMPKQLYSHGAFLLQLLHLHGLQLKNEDWKRLIKATFNLQHILPLDNTAGYSTQIPGFDLAIEYFMISNHRIGAVASASSTGDPIQGNGSERQSYMLTPEALVPSA